MGLLGVEVSQLSVAAFDQQLPETRGTEPSMAPATVGMTQPRGGWPG